MVRNMTVLTMTWGIVLAGVNSNEVTEWLWLLVEAPTASLQLLDITNPVKTIGDSFECRISFKSSLSSIQKVRIVINTKILDILTDARMFLL